MRGELTLYDVLGVGRQASTDDVRRAYRRKALQLHPDRRAGGAFGAQASASALGSASSSTFAELHRAYETLSDDIRRAAYDSDLLSREGSSADLGFRNSDAAQILARRAAELSASTFLWDARFAFSRNGRLERRQMSRAPASSDSTGRSANGIPAARAATASRVHRMAPSCSFPTPNLAVVDPPPTTTEVRLPCGHHPTAWSAPVASRQLHLRQATLQPVAASEPSPIVARASSAVPRAHRNSAAMPHSVADPAVFPGLSEPERIVACGNTAKLKASAKTLAIFFDEGTHDALQGPRSGTSGRALPRVHTALPTVGSAGLASRPSTTSFASRRPLLSRGMTPVTAPQFNL
jgi:curved DNA-binding protein CbpA